MAKTEVVRPDTVNVAPLASPEVDPVNVKLSSEGFCWREILARLPAGMTQDDLRSPKIWRRVQGNRQHALVRLDHLLILAHDESWMARAIVTHATDSEAHLMIEKVGTFKEIGAGSLFSDGVYRVAWDGTAYRVERVSDGIRVDNVGYTTEGQAIAAIRNQYPKKVG